MATLEERVQALEQEVATRKQTEEMLTIAVRALVSKEAFEKLQETIEASQKQNGKLLDALIAHDRLTNEQLAELRNRDTELDGKIAGLQTEMRQRFTEQDGKIVGIQTEMRQRFTEQDGKIVGIQIEMRQRFTGIETVLTQILERLPEKP